ncbi:hypothetical protein M8J77_011999 [Diaphorina citri]|nr:hypothetical protein M8J77_011999 [Diaphorina citri]
MTIFVLRHLTRSRMFCCLSPRWTMARDAVSTVDRLLSQVAPSIESPDQKITVVGAGQVGMACTYSILTQGIYSNFCLIDSNEDRCKGEMLDLQHGAPFLRSPKIESGSDIAMSEGSRIVIITAGVRSLVGETRLQLVDRNVKIFKDLIPKIAKGSPDCILLIISNPVDVLTYISWKLSGFPKNRVIGSGTNLDSMRFRVLLAQKLGLSPESVHGFIIGEHGDSSVPVWSGVNVAGVTLKELNPTIGTEQDTENFVRLHADVVNSAYEVIKLKGYTSWALGLSVASISHTLLNNTNKIHAVSTLIQGHHGIEEEVFLSLPCVMADNGVTHIINQNLTPDEAEKLRKSAATISQIQKGLL